MFAITVLDDAPDATYSSVEGTKVLVFEDNVFVSSVDDISSVNERNNIENCFDETDTEVSPTMIIDLNELVEKIQASEHLKVTLINHGILKKNK